MDEIKTTVEQFRQGALNCMEAGFDGVEVKTPSQQAINSVFFDRLLVVAAFIVASSSFC